MLHFRWTSVGGACSDKQVMDQLRVKSEICYTSKEVCKISWKSCDAAIATGRTPKNDFVGICTAFLKLLGVPQGNRAINIPTFNFRHKTNPWNLTPWPLKESQSSRGSILKFYFYPPGN